MIETFINALMTVNVMLHNIILKLFSLFIQLFKNCIRSVIAKVWVLQEVI